MEIKVGSKNRVKIDVVKGAVKQFSAFSKAHVTGVQASSGVSRQPKSLEETIRGAMNRARNAFRGCDYGIGIEDGIMPAPLVSEWINVSACVIYDGSKSHIGLAPSFVYPRKVAEAALSEGSEIGEQLHHLRKVEHKSSSEEEGAIGLLSNGLISRKDYLKLGVLMALIHLENSRLNK
ncbi:MAG: inosine/xanthosine triphosphatase [Candidatus Aenigmarchaeota archaeon]|nr:inosine/xanthosine triphosphatase [Candidatus Aenigmarchaeota archaeon]